VRGDEISTVRRQAQASDQRVALLTAWRKLLMVALCPMMKRETNRNNGL
jgi:hypothetical protein